MSEAACVVDSRLASASDLVLTRFDAFLQDPNDPETNHKLRVSIRTLRGLVAFFEPWQKRKQNKSAQRKLKKVVAKTSRLRELDVLAALGEAQQPGNTELIAFLEAQAAAERSRVYRQLSGVSAREKLESVSGDLHEIAWKRDFDAAEAREQFDELAASLQHDIDNLDTRDYELVHSVRKRAKQVRYVAEQFNEILGEDTIAIAKHMKSQQDSLGALCDAQVNRDLVAAFLSRTDLSPTLRDSLERLTI